MVSRKAAITVVLPIRPGALSTGIRKLLLSSKADGILLNFLRPAYE